MATFHELGAIEGWNLFAIVGEQDTVIAQRGDESLSAVVTEESMREMDEVLYEAVRRLEPILGEEEYQACQDDEPSFEERCQAYIQHMQDGSTHDDHPSDLPEEVQEALYQQYQQRQEHKDGIALLRSIGCTVIETPHYDNLMDGFAEAMKRLYK